MGKQSHTRRREAMRDLGHPGECDRYGAVMTINALVTDPVLDDAYAWRWPAAPRPGDPERGHDH